MKVLHATTDKAAGLNTLADELLEIRRYVRIGPKYVEANLPALIKAIAGSDLPTNREVDRLMTNLAVGVGFINADPEVLRGYLYAAAFEVRNAAFNAEKEASR